MTVFMTIFFIAQQEKIHNLLDICTGCWRTIPTSFSLCSTSAQPRGTVATSGSFLQDCKSSYDEPWTLTRSTWGSWKLLDPLNCLLLHPTATFCTIRSDCLLKPLSKRFKRFKFRWLANIVTYCTLIEFSHFINFWERKY